MIEIRHLRKEYDLATPLEDVSATINDGDIISVIGPSGTGKSTLLRCLNLLDAPTSGEIYLDGEEITAPGYDIKKARQKMGMVFQSFNLFGHLTVIENLMLAPMEVLGKSKQEAYETGMKYLLRVGMADRALSYPDELSGGQKQRVAIARTLCMDPDVLLLDEPTSALDPTMVGEVQAVIRELAKTGKTMMIVTHEMNFARGICNRVFYMDEGGIYEDGPPEQIFDNPLKEKTKRFIKKLKVLELEIREKTYDFLGLQSEIENYCNKNQISRRSTLHIHLAFEELVHQLLVKRMEKPNIEVTIEYNQEAEKTAFDVRYGGERFDPTEEKGLLEMSVLKSAAEDIKYTWNQDAEPGNELSLKILDKR